MLLQSYRKEIFRSECMPGAQTLHCFAHLDQDIDEVLPYLNTVLGGFGFTPDPPSLTLRPQGKLITLHPRKIAVNALNNEAEADKILKWLHRKINQAWEQRDRITPSFAPPEKPQLMEVLKRLPKTNCRECGAPTCMVFAAQVVEGAKGPDNCPPLNGEQAEQLQSYLGRFCFE